MAGMTKGERQELGQLVRKREKVMKIQAHERSTALLAEFDAQSARVYHWNEDPVWNRVKEEAQKTVEIAKTEIAARCRELGIPAEFAPGLEMYWHGRGSNAVRERMTELRRAAKSRIEAIEQQALTKIEQLSLQAQTEIVSHGLDGEAAKAFLSAMPSMETLMPPVQFDEIESLWTVKLTQRRLSYDA